MKLKSFVIGLVSVGFVVAASAPASAREVAAPGLAATGADLASLIPWIIVGAVVVLAGGVLLIVRSRRKPTEPTTAAPEIEQPKD